MAAVLERSRTVLYESVNVNRSGTVPTNAHFAKSHLATLFNAHSTRNGQGKESKVMTNWTDEETFKLIDYGVKTRYK